MQAPSWSAQIQNGSLVFIISIKAWCAMSPYFRGLRGAVNKLKSVVGDLVRHSSPSSDLQGCSRKWERSWNFLGLSKMFIFRCAWLYVSWGAIWVDIFICLFILNGEISCLFCKQKRGVNVFIKLHVLLRIWDLKHPLDIKHSHGTRCLVRIEGDELSKRQANEQMGDTSKRERVLIIFVYLKL